MGAWIEIPAAMLSKSKVIVAPFMGAWIEISVSCRYCCYVFMSHPLWVRGLKFLKMIGKLHSVFCRTLYGCVD